MYCVIAQWWQASMRQGIPLGPVLRAGTILLALGAAGMLCLKAPAHPSKFTGSLSQMNRRSLVEQEPRLQEASSVPWHVRPGKYMLMMCQFGRMSNQVQCLKNSLAVSAVLNRTLLIPPVGAALFRGKLVYKWTWELALDWRRTSACLKAEHGPNAVMPLQKYLEEQGLQSLRLDQVFCLRAGGWRNCMIPPALKVIVPAQGGTVTFPPLGEDLPQWVLPSPFTHSVVPPGNLTAHLGSLEDDVITVGETFNVYMQDQFNSQDVILRSPEEGCSNLWRPHPAVGEFITGFIATVLNGTAFAAIHFRRGDFYREYREGRSTHRELYSTYPSIGEAASAVREKLAGAPHLDRIFVATDARPVEFQMFRQLLQNPAAGGRRFSRVISMNHVVDGIPWIEQQPWAKALVEADRIPGQRIGYILADKGISAQGEVFLGSRWSSFSKDINEMRRAEGTKSKLDSTL